MARVFERSSSSLHVVGCESAEVDPAHQAELVSQLAAFSNAVSLEMRFGLSAAQGDREAFQSHFSALSASLDRWNSAVELTATAPEALWHRFALAARERGITEPPFLVGVLIDDVATWTLERCRREELDMPYTANLEHYVDRIGGSESISVYMMGRKVAVLPGGPEVDVEGSVAAAENLIQALLEEARTSEEAVRVVETRDTLLGLKIDLLDDLDMERMTPVIRPALGCPRCSGDYAPRPEP
jgi:hypothetical protein